VSRFKIGIAVVILATALSAPAYAARAAVAAVMAAAAGMAGVAVAMAAAAVCTSEEVARRRWRTFQRPAVDIAFLCPSECRRQFGALDRPQRRQPICNHWQPDPDRKIQCQTRLKR